MTDEDEPKIVLPQVVWPEMDVGESKFILAKVNERDYLWFGNFPVEYHGSILRRLLEMSGISDFNVYDGIDKFPKESGDNYTLFGVGRMGFDKGSHIGNITWGSGKYREIVFCCDTVDRLEALAPEWNFNY